MRKLQKRNKLCLEHLAWAQGIARHVAAVLPTWFTADDLYGPVEIALVRLAEQYEPARGIPFQAFASRRLYGACFDAVRRREYRERAHESLEKVQDMRLGQADKVAVWTSPCRNEPADTAPSPEARTAANEQFRVWSIVQTLPPRHALVILSVYGGDMTLESLSELVDVGPSRLSQIHREALGMLRESCAEMAA